MPQAKVNGQNIHFEDTGGSGPAVILAHGFLMNQAMFEPQVRALSPEFRVVRWDARGWGRTEYDGRPFSYWDSADDCVRLLDHLGIERAVVGGMSQGGFTALRAALRYPDRVKALVLISTQAAVDAPEAIAGNRQMLDTWRAMGPIDPLVEAIAGLLLGARETWEPWVSQWKTLPKDHLDTPTEALLSRDDITARLGEITCPAIVFHGTADGAITLERGEQVARGLVGCKQFVKVEGAAHAPNLTHPEQVNPPLLAFLRQYA
ncbi:alpha/beta fold hydrolase [Polyangium aurulentum]|uniref:alpha/beta fold hydrolase n=1 Tax=Polyangium aurulentum TaxID=2567896 RepID=UPI0010AEC896|nr:alpha/beta hydrolase [Polyangium aurulentum]UQA59423.1 alpha/beta hydrolase [Polyangium aurulentum]